MKYDEKFQNIITNKDRQIDGLTQLVSTLVDKIDSLEASINSYEHLVKELRDTIVLLNGKLYGAKSEKTYDNEKDTKNVPSSSKTLPDRKQDADTPEKSEKEKKPRKPYKRPERRAYDEIEERVEVLEPDAEELKGAKFVRSEKSFRFYMIPARIVKVIYDRRIYSKDGRLIIPKLPYVPEEFHKRHADPSLMAGILTNKFCYHLPVHRQLKLFQNAGANIARSTLYDWCGAAIDALEGLYHTIREEVLKGDYLNVDETTVSVIDEDVHHAKKEYMWGLVDTRNRLAFYDYDHGSRGRAVIDNILHNYIGMIQSDGYTAYRSLYSDDKNEKVKRLSCLCHIRRKFKESENNDRKHSLEALGFIGKIYRLEKCFKRLMLLPEKIREYRIRFTVPVFHKFKQWLDKQLHNPKILDDSIIGKAISYAHKEFDALKYIFDNGEYRVDNNAAERALRGTKLGMNNFLFFGNHKNAKRGAIIYTIVESCKMNDVNVFDYLTEVFSREPKVGETWADLLPNKLNK